MLSEFYYEQHAACPACGSDSIKKTCIGCLGDKDTNRAKCCTCKWVGIVHDLVPQKAIEASHARD